MKDINIIEIIDLVKQVLEDNFCIDGDFIISGPNTPLDSVQIINVAMTFEDFIFKQTGRNINCYDMLIGVVDDISIDKFVIELKKIKEET